MTRAWSYTPLFQRRANTASNVATLVLVAGGAVGLAQPVPVVNPGGVVNGASYASPVAAGGFASVFGSNLALATISYKGTQPLPESLAGTTVQIGGFAAPEYFVSPGQLNIQIPWELSGQTQALLTVTASGGTSTPVAVNLAPFAPALFSVGATGSGQGWIFNSDNSLNGPSNPNFLLLPLGMPPAQVRSGPTFPGGTIQIGATDLGPVTNQPPDGGPPSTSAYAINPVSVAIGGLPAVVISSQLCGPSLTCPVPDASYLVTANVPGAVAVSPQVPVTITMGGVSSNTVTMNIGPPPACLATATNSCNFNGTSVPAGDYIWFNASLKASNVPGNGATIDFTGGNVSFPAGGVSFPLLVPNGKIIFSPSVNCSSTTFSAATNTWTTTVPISGDDEIFLTGLAWPVPGGGLAGGVNPVSFSGTYTSESSVAGLSIQMFWSAAAYSKFTTNYNALEVKAGHQTACAVNNGDHAGTPEGTDGTHIPWKTYVVGGARGGGGSNFTGSWSSTLSVPICK